MNKLTQALLNLNNPSEFFVEMKNNGELDSISPLLAKLVGVEQSKEHHPEGDVFTHTMMVVDAAAKIRDFSNHKLAFMLSALTHDLGKITTTKNLDGKIVAYGHDKELHLIDEFFKDVNIEDVDLINSVKLLVSNHMRINSSQIMFNGSNKAIKKIIDSARGEYVDIYDLLLISEADHKGRLFNPEVLDYTKQRKWFLNKIAEIENEEENKIVPLVEGKDLISLGIKPGVEFKRILSEALKMQKQGASKENILEKIKDSHCKAI